MLAVLKTLLINLYHVDIIKSLYIQTYKIDYFK